MLTPELPERSDRASLYDGSRRPKVAEFAPGARRHELGEACTEYILVCGAGALLVLVAWTVLGRVPAARCRLRAMTDTVSQAV